MIKSGTEIYRVLGIRNVNAACLGYRKQIGGYKWKFK